MAITTTAQPGLVGNTGQSTAMRLFLAVASGGLIYGFTTYVYLSGFFLRASYTQTAWQGVIATLLGAVVMLMVYATISGKLERRAVTELELAPAAKELAIGVMLGAGLYSLCVVILMVLGNYRIEGFNALGVLVGGLAVTIATGVYEELVFRGAVFRIAEQWLGTWAALVISSVVFGYVHLEGDMSHLRGVISITLWAGPMLAALYIVTRRLWVPIALHAAWNFTQGWIWSGAVSGTAMDDGLVKPAISGSDWLTGGAFGVEASVIAMAVCGGFAIALMVVAVRRGLIVPPAWRRTSAD
jgi:uncharacterized protein